MVAISRDFGIKNFEVPVVYLNEAEAQFPGVSGSLDVEVIRQLGRLGLSAEHPKLAWAASVEGLKRGGPTEAFFLFLRARATPPVGRRGACVDRRRGIGPFPPRHRSGGGGGGELAQSLRRRLAFPGSRTGARSGAQGVGFTGFPEPPSNQDPTTAICFRRDYARARTAGASAARFRVRSTVTKMILTRSRTTILNSAR